MILSKETAIKSVCEDEDLGYEYVCMLHDIFWSHFHKLFVTERDFCNYVRRWILLWHDDPSLYVNFDIFMNNEINA